MFCRIILGMSNLVKFYKIISPNTNKCYIGCTQQSLGQRWSEHKYHMTKENRSNVSSAEIIKCGDASIELIEQEEFTTKERKRLREAELIQSHEFCVNRMGKKVKLTPTKN